MREWRARYGRLPSSYDWSRTHARARGGEALARLAAGDGRRRHRHRSVRELDGGRRRRLSRRVSPLGGGGFAGRVRYLSSGMPENLAQRAGATDGDAATPDGWHELAVANPTFLLERLGSECTDLQGLRELTVNGLDAIATLGTDRPGQVVWDLDWGAVRSFRWPGAEAVGDRHRDRDDGRGSWAATSISWRRVVTSSR